MAQSRLLHARTARRGAWAAAATVTAGTLITAALGAINSAAVTSPGTPF